MLLQWTKRLNKYVTAVLLIAGFQRPVNPPWDEDKYTYSSSTRTLILPVSINNLAIAMYVTVVLLVTGFFERPVNRTGSPGD